MKYTAAFLAAGSMMALATPSMAQDETPFTGFKVEGVAGYDVSQAGSSTDNEVDEDNDQSIDGFLYGVGVGYDFNAGGVVLGLEAELTDSTAETEFTDGDFEGFGFGNVETGRDLYFGARAGVLAQPDLLVYAKAGYTNARYNINASFDGEDFRSSIDTDGFRLGAGLEYVLSGNSYAKVEYRYSNYGDAEIDFEGDAADVDLGSIDTDRHQVVAGFGFRF